MTIDSIIYEVDTNKPIEINLDKIVKGRALIQANSGGGKSYITRKFLEETNDKIQQIIIDPEGEFATLREKYDYLLVGKDGADIQIDVRHAELLARKLMETGNSAILDLYEMSPFERIRFVKVFCDALVNLPKKLWHPCLVIIDEIHTFAPESSKGRSESLEAVASLASRGRKRGYALIGATQKLSKFHKDVAAELNTKFTGRCTLDIDQKRAAQELGMKDHTQLRNLDFEFFLFGPGIDGIKKVKSYPVKTTHEDIGSSNVIKLGNPTKIKNMMSDFAELPQEAENQLKSTEDLKRKIEELTNDLRKANHIAPPPDQNLINKAYEQGFAKASQISQSNFNTKLGEIKLIFGESIKNVIEFPTKLDSLLSVKDSQIPLGELPKSLIKPVEISKKSVVIPDNSFTSSEFGKCEIEILSALKQLGGKSNKIQIGVVAGYSNRSGGFGNALSRLKTNQYVIQEGSALLLSDLGKIEAKHSNGHVKTHEDLMSFWTNKVGKCPAAILTVLATRGSFTKDYLGQQTGYSHNSGGFNNALSKIKNLGLAIKKDDGSYILSEDMWP